ncbi:hypothetical protein ABZS93_35075, partial [Streptomyces sp900116325]
LHTPGPTAGGVEHGCGGALDNDIATTSQPPPAFTGTDGPGHAPGMRELAATEPSPPALPEPVSPFEMSWTGNEPLSAYASEVSPPDLSVKTMAIASMVLCLLGVPATILGAINLEPEGELGGWFALLMTGAIATLVGVVYGLYAIFYGSRKAGAERRHRSGGGWTLHVGPHHIMATSTAARRSFTWDQIQEVTLEEIKGKFPWDRNQEVTLGEIQGGKLPYAYTGVHLRFAQGDSQRTKQPRGTTVGWPYPPETIEVREDQWYPVCVLGPMSEQQREQLTDALARYARRRWEPELA